MLRVVTDDDGRAETRSAIDEICAEGARRMLAAALEAEVDASSPPWPTSVTSRATGWWCATATPSPAG